MRSRAMASIALLGCLLGGCDDETSADTDADADADADDDTDSDADTDGDAEVDAEGDAWHVGPPTGPEPPRLRSWDCPDGWLSVAHETVFDETGAPFSWCEPPPAPRLRSGDWITPLEEGEAEGDRPICDPAVRGTFPVVGFADCQPLGDPCPEGDFPEVPAEIPGTRWYVLAGATGGDGTEAAPWATIGEAVVAAEAGDVVVIGAGTYLENVTIDRDLTLWGRCVQDTIIEGTGRSEADINSEGGVVLVEMGAKATIRNLRITGPHQGIRAHGDLDVAGVWVTRTTHGGINCCACEASIRDVLVDSTVTVAGVYSGFQVVIDNDPAFGEESAIATVSRMTVENNVECLGGHDLYVGGPGADCSLDDVLLRHGCYGMYLGRGALVDARRILVDHHTEFGILCPEYEYSFVADHLVVLDTDDSGIHLQGPSQARITHALVSGTQGVFVGVDEVDATLEDVVIEASRAGPDWPPGDGPGFGLAIRSDANVSLTRALIDDSSNCGLHASGDGVVARIYDLIIRRTGDEADLSVSVGGIHANGGARLEVSRARIEDSLLWGIVLVDPGTTASVDNLSITGTREVEVRVDLVPAGVDVVLASLDLSRAVIADCSCFGLLSYGEESSLSAEDVVVTGTLPTADGLGGVGLTVQANASTSVLHGVFADSHAYGILALEAASLSLEDVSVLDTASLDYDGYRGRGLHVEGGGEIEVVHSEFARNRDVSIAVFDAETTATLRDVHISDSLERECVDLPEGDPNACIAGRGYGLGAYDGAEVTIDGVVVESSAALGVQLRNGGTIAGQGLTIRGCPVAVNLQSLPDGYEWESAVRDLLLEGNGADVDTSEMSFAEDSIE